MRLICKDQIQEKKESKRINQMSIFTEKMSFYNDGQYSSEKKNCKFQMITLKKYTAKYYLETKPKKKKICYFFLYPPQTTTIKQKQKCLHGNLCIL